MMTNRIVSKFLASLALGVVVGVMCFSSTSSRSDLWQYIADVKCDPDQMCKNLIVDDGNCLKWGAGSPECKGDDDYAKFTGCVKEEDGSCKQHKTSSHNCSGKCKQKTIWPCTFIVPGCDPNYTAGGTN